MSNSDDEFLQAPGSSASESTTGSFEMIDAASPTNQETTNQEVVDDTPPAEPMDTKTEEANDSVSPVAQSPASPPAVPSVSKARPTTSTDEVPPTVKECPMWPAGTCSSSALTGPYMVHYMCLLGGLLSAWVLNSTANVSIMTMIGFSVLAAFLYSCAAHYLKSQGVSLPSLSIPPNHAVVTHVRNFLSDAPACAVEKFNKIVSWETPQYSIRALAFAWLALRFQCLLSLGTLVFTVFAAVLTPFAWEAAKPAAEPHLREVIIPKAKETIKLVKEKIATLPRNILLAVLGGIALIVVFAAPSIVRCCGVMGTITSLTTIAALYAVHPVIIQRVVIPHINCFVAEVSGKSKKD